MSAEQGRAESVYSAIKTRRAVRDYGPGPVPKAHLTMILQAGRLASSGGNNRLQRFLVLQDRHRVGLVKSLAPGMLGLPPAVILICTDRTIADARGIQLDKDHTTWVDVGTAAMNMELMAHVLGLGSCPVTSLSRRGLQAVLELPETAIPELILMVGRLRDREPVEGVEPAERPSLEGFAFWERYGDPALTTGGGGGERRLPAR